MKHATTLADGQGPTDLRLTTSTAGGCEQEADCMANHRRSLRPSYCCRVGQPVMASCS